MNTKIRGFRWFEIGAMRVGEISLAAPFPASTSHRMGLALLALLLVTLLAPVRAQLTTAVNPDGTLVITGGCAPGALTIPDTIDGRKVTRIGGLAFYGCTSLTRVTIPDGVTGIGDRTFAGCTNLKDIKIPNSVTGIASDAFSGCSSLTSVEIPTNLTIIEDGVFSGCSSLSSLTIPNGVTSIASEAFSGCSSLASVTIPNGVTSIGSMAFFRCSTLTNATIPDSVTTIQAGAFQGCSSLTSVTLPTGLTIIEYGVFFGCSSLSSLTIPNGVTKIAEHAFDGCSSLTTIGVDPLNPIYSSMDGVLFDKGQTTLLDYPEGRPGDYQIPNGVTRIGSMAFFRCRSLTGVIIPSGVTDLGLQQA